MLFKYIDTPTNYSDMFTTNTTDTLTTQILMYLITLHINNHQTNTPHSTDIYLNDMAAASTYTNYDKQLLNLNLVSNISKIITGWLLPHRVKKPKQKKRRLYIHFHKWRMLKNLLKKLKNTRIRTNLPARNNLNIRASYQQKPAQINFRKNYKNLRFKTKQQFNHLFKTWTQTAQQYIQGNSIYKKNNTINSTHKQVIMSTFINYVLKHATKKRLLKKLKRRLGIKAGAFIKNRCVRLYHNLAIKKPQTCLVPWDANALENIFFKRLDSIKKLRHQKNTTDSKFTNHLNKSVKFSHKTAIFETLFKISNNNGIYKNYINNTPLLITSFEQNRYNRIFLENLNKSKQNSTATTNILNSNSVSNYTPMHIIKCALTNSRQYRMYSNTTLRLHNNQSMYFYVQFILTYLEKYTQKKIWLRVNTKMRLNQLWKNYCAVFNKTQSFHIKKFHKLINTQELLDIFVQTLITCDLKILLFYIKYKLENTHFKNHKKILSILFDTFKKNKAALSLAGVKGFSFDIRGKVGVAGNAKKRHLFFSTGKISTTSQNLKAQWQQINIWTPTGQMGVTCLIQY